MTHALRPIFTATVLAFGLIGASSSQVASTMNWEGSKSSFTYTPVIGESLERIIAKTMPNSDLKPELLAEAFKELNPMQLSKEANSVAKFNTAIKVPNQNQLANMVEAQLGDQQTLRAFTKVEANPAPMKPQAKGLLAGTKTATSKINPKTESWVRFPARLIALSKKVEGWFHFSNLGVKSVTTADWVHYPFIAQADNTVD